MKKLVVFISLFILPIGAFIINGKSAPEPVATDIRQLFVEMNLENIINFKAFEQAMTGYSKLNAKNKDIFALIDFTKPSTVERLYVLDMKHKKLLFTTHVAHGKNSGDNYATSFSNKNGSHKSSLGFYVTENTYEGRNGYSLILNGLEKGINDKAKERAIVIHGADYSDPSVINSSGRLGRSFGCPALPYAVTKPIINTIKEGALLYIYADDPTYVTQSKIISSNKF